jgi:hypothetical protein
VPGIAIRAISDPAGVDLPLDFNPALVFLDAYVELLAAGDDYVHAGGPSLRLTSLKSHGHHRPNLNRLEWEATQLFLPGLC